MNSLTLGLYHDLISRCAATTLDSGNSQHSRQTLQTFSSSTDLRSALLTRKIDAALVSSASLEDFIHPELATIGVLPRLDIRTVVLLKAGWREKSTLRGAFASETQSAVVTAFLADALPNKEQKIDWDAANDALSALKGFWASEWEVLAIPKYLLDLLLSESEYVPEPFTKISAEALGALTRIVLPLSEVPAIPGAGTVWIVASRSDSAIKPKLEALSCAATQAAFREERRTIEHLELNPLFACVTSLCLPYGYLTYVRAKQNRSGHLAQQLFVQSGTPLPRTQAERIFPSNEGEAQLFDRERLELFPLPELTNRGIWVAKAEALPTDLKLPATSVIWTAGVKTWKRLAARGVLVNGSADGLGEDSSNPPANLFPEVTEWLKFSHAEGIATPERALISTYRLVPKTDLPDLNQRTHFFWSSGSAFELALSQQPSIKPRWHASGPGHTHRTIVQALGGSERVRIFPDYYTWRSEVVQ
ncbi:MAG: hypothetical protein K1X83_12290 [Oligoflexia bacterium]|nr:hypothetical protein [Oligoflexia bacterium]